MKKVVKILLSTIIVIILLGIIFFAVDYYRVSNNQTPIFCIKSLGGPLRDGGTVEYYGLGYKVIDFNTTEGFDDIKIGTWFMSYDKEVKAYNEAQQGENNTKATINGVVVKVDSYGLLVMGTQDTNALYRIGFTDEGDIGFKQGQEISIDFDGSGMESYPALLGNVTEIKIEKEKSDTEIPENILRYAYSSKDNVTVSINQISNSMLSIIIGDSNEIPYTYSDSYFINKKVKNENYTGVGKTVGENTNNTVAGFTGTGSEYIMEELTKNPDILPKNTIIYYSPETIEEKENTEYTGIRFDWSNLYGELGEGEYEFVYSAEGSFSIRIEFNINEGGVISYKDAIMY